VSEDRRAAALLMAAPPRLVADVSADDPGTASAARRLTPGAWEAWERGRAEIAARNAALLAQSVAAQRAEIAAAKLRLLTGAVAREPTAEAAAAAPDDPPPVGSIAWHRAKARAWAVEQRRITDDHLRALTAQARARIGEP
jgi:hypothetical protein